MNRKYRKTVIAGNWKMNKTPTETKAFMTEIAAARMIVNGLQIGLPADTIRTRLRELYF